MKAYIPTLILALIAFGLQTVGAEELNTNAWRLARWGMTDSEILAAFKGEATLRPTVEKYKTGISRVWIEGLKIEGKPFNASFVLDPKTDKLKQIILELDKSEKSTDLFFPKFEQALTEKYGTPDFRHDDRKTDSLSRTRSWNRGKTRIELKLFELHSINLKHLAISYEEALLADKENL
jgi:hypothetical protein